MKALRCAQMLAAAALMLWSSCQTCDPNDPCCGDPCCGDPCCGDPCCGDPCCGDPSCGGYNYSYSTVATGLAAAPAPKFSSVKERAAYNLVCSVDNISLQSPAEGRVQAQGCGKTMTYQCACPKGQSSKCLTPTCRAEAAAPKAAGH